MQKLTRSSLKALKRVSEKGAFLNVKMGVLQAVFLVPGIWLLKEKVASEISKFVF